MAAKLVIIKHTRPNLDIPFYTLSDEQRAAVQNEAFAVVVGERIFANGFKKVRTLFFPTLEFYQKWSTSAVALENQTGRDAYNAANGITLEQIVVDLPDYTL